MVKYFSNGEFIKQQIFRIIGGRNSLELGLFFYQFSHFLVVSSLLEVFCGFKIDGARNVRRRQHTDDYVKNLSDFLVWHPLFFTQHFLTDFSLSDVRMVNGSFELEVRKRKRECLREINVKDEFAGLEWGACRSLDGDFPMEETLFGFCLDSSKNGKGSTYWSFR